MNLEPVARANNQSWAFEQRGMPQEAAYLKTTHDLRNVITGLVGNLSLLRETPGLPSDIAEKVALIEKAALRARALSLELDGPPEAQAAPKVATPPPVAAPQPKPAKTGERILAMDDEPGIRTLLSAALTHFGYEAITVPDGQEALNAYQKAIAEKKPFSAVIMDLTIPGGMGGKETVQALKAIDPAVRAIVSSGHSADPAVTDFRTFGFVARVEKPYRIQELGTVIRDALRN